MTQPFTGLVCPTCQAPASEEANYCAACGAPLAETARVICPACEAPSPSHARFCHACAAPLSSPGQADRRIVTVLFADLSGYTQLTERMDPEEVQELIAECLTRLSDCISQWGGHVDKFIGDCVMAIFGAPVAYENEAERAVRAALAMHASLEDWGETYAKDRDEREYRPQLRVGINTGPVVMGLFQGGGARNYTAVGDTVNVAARLERHCQPGRILVDATTYQQTRHLFEFEEEQTLQVKGRREPVRARHVVGALAERGKARGFLGKRTTLIGRTDELARLRELWRAAAGGSSQVCLVVGPAGIGKSRLVEEFVQQEDIADQTCRGRSYPHAGNTPWEPIAELLHELYHLPVETTPEKAAARIIETAPGAWPPEQRAGVKVALGGPVAEAGELQSHTPTERREQVSAAVSRALFDGPYSPRLLVLEDLHWADRTTLEYLRGLPERDLRGRFMVVLISRPPLPDEDALAEMLQAIPERIEVGPLSTAEARSFVDELFGSHELDEQFIGRVVQRAEGNPLFIEEILKTLVEGEALHVDGEVWRTSGDFEDLAVPDSIESVLTTRIDGLDPGAKTVLQYAAIVGRRFWSGVLADALAHRPVERELDNLLQGAFVRALPHSVVKGDREFAFEHLLLQQVAYDGMLRRLRSELHGAVADWLEGSLVGSTGERDEWIAFHHLRSKEPHRAAPFLERSARAARAQGALRDAQALVERALALAAETGTKADLLLLAEQLAAETGDVTRRLGAIEALESLAEGSADERIAAEAGYRRARYLADSGELRKARSAAEAALAGFEALGDISQQADVLRTLGRISHLLGNFPEALRFYRSSLPLEREAGDRYGQAEVFERLGLVQVDLGNYTTGLDHFAAAHDMYLELGDRLGEARVIAHQSLAYRSLGEYERAEDVARTAVDLADRCGSRQARAKAVWALARAVQARGDKDQAGELYWQTCETARDLGQPALESEAWLGLAEVQTGAEARNAIEAARRLAGERGLAHVEILALTRATEIELEEGNLGAADAASATAVRLLDVQGSIQGPEEAVLYARYRVLEALGRREEALEVVRRARTIILNRANRIEDPVMRERYLHAIELNEEILEKSADRPGSSA